MKYECTELERDADSVHSLPTMSESGIDVSETHSEKEWDDIQVRY